MGVDRDELLPLYKIRSKLLSRSQTLLASDTLVTKVEKCIEYVAKETGVDPAAIVSRSRKRHIVEARAYVCYTLKQDKYTYETIGLLFNKHHSSVVGYIKKVEKLLRSDEVTKAWRRLILKELRLIVVKINQEALVKNVDLLYSNNQRIIKKELVDG